MKRWIAILSVTGLFVIGILIGSLSTHLYYAQRLLDPGGPPRAGVGIFASRLERKLDLTSEQRREIERILEESHAQAAALRGEMAPRVRAQIERTHERIVAVLTPEQREEFDRMRRSHGRRARDWFLGGHGPGHGPGHGRGRGPHPDGPPPPPID